MQSRGALDGIRVIDITQVGAGPMCACLLAQWGADVIKIEHPVRGDSLRGLQSTGVGATQRKNGKYNYMFEQPNMNKRSITLDLAHKEGQAVLHRLVTKSDVLLAAMRTRDIKKFDIEYETLKAINPRLVYALITGYGTKGSEQDSAGYDATCYFARSGITHMMAGDEGVPVWPRPGFGDMPSGMFCACGIMVALFAREKLGVGQAVNTNLFNNGVWALAADTMAAQATRTVAAPHYQKTCDNALANYYKTKDNRWILLFHLQAAQYWERVCQTIGLQNLINDPRFNSVENRKTNTVELIKIMDIVFSQKTLAEWKAILAKTDLIYSPVQTPVEAVEDPQAKANDFYATFNHPVWGQVELLPAPQKLSETPGTYRTPPPEWGQHTEEVLQELGYNWNEINRLKDLKVIA
jgi:crotonobetainyl-CoA:carnitine CoA-transferase CaiB-like acyl-CoA transferase